LAPGETLGAEEEIADIILPNCSRESGR
jgi:hypothetical protein